MPDLLREFVDRVVTDSRPGATELEQEIEGIIDIGIDNTNLCLSISEVNESWEHLVDQ